MKPISLIASYPFICAARIFTHTRTYAPKATFYFRATKKAQFNEYAMAHFLRYFQRSIMAERDNMFDAAFERLSILPSCGAAAWHACETRILLAFAQILFFVMGMMLAYYMIFVSYYVDAYF